MYADPKSSTDRVATRPRRPSRGAAFWFLMATTALCAVVIAFSAVYTMWAEWAAIGREHALRTTEATRLLEERGTRTVSATDAVLRRIAERSAAEGLAWSRTAAGAGWLAEMARALPSQGTLWLLEASGNLVATSTAHPAPSANYADREYFPLHRDRAVPYHLGPAVKGRVMKDYFAFTLTRRIDDAGGAFAGVIVAAIETRMFADLFRTFLLPADSMAGIFRSDGAMIFRQPMHDDYLGRRLPAATVRMAAANENGMGEMRSPFDGVERRVAYRQFDGLPLVAIAGTTLRARQEAWLARAGVPILIASTAIAVVLVSGWMAARSARREHMAFAHMLSLTAELRQARQAAESANAEKTRFLAAISHDVRQPVQSLVLLIATLRGVLHTPRAPQLLGMMEHSADALRAILDELLDLTRIEMGVVAPKLASVPVAQVMAGLEEEYRLRAAERGLTFRLVPCGAAVVTDPHMLRRVLRNLIENALKYTEAGGVLVGCRRRPEQVVIEVHDTGRGIPPEQIEAIWREFHQIDNAERDLSKGLGLGLAIVKRLAQALRHDVSVDSRLGHGSCFRVSLPRAA